MARPTLFERAVNHWPGLASLSATAALGTPGILWGDWSENGNGDGSEALAVLSGSSLLLGTVGSAVAIICRWNGGLSGYRRFISSRPTRHSKRAVVHEAQGNRVKVMLYERKGGRFEEPFRFDYQWFNAETESAEALTFAQEFLRGEAASQASPDAIALGRNLDALNKRRRAKSVDRRLLGR